MQPDDRLPMAPALQVLATAPIRRHEVPSHHHHHDHHLIDGVIDLLAQTPEGAWWVVDFKTGHSDPHHLHTNHAHQLRLYAHAVSEATGGPVRAVIVGVGADPRK